MRPDNPLTDHFISRHTLEAARVLEKLPAQQSVDFMQSIEEQSASRLFHFFIPPYATDCLESMSDDLLNACTEHETAAVCRALTGLPPVRQRAIIDRMQGGLARLVQTRLSHPVDSVARYITRGCPVLTPRVSAGEARRRLEHMRYEEGCQVYVVDDEHKLMGSIETARLLNAPRSALLDQLLVDQVRPPILISSRLGDVQHHEGWLQHRRLPVVDRDGIYMGELDYETVTRVARQPGHREDAGEAFGSLLSLAGLYWLSASWLIDSLFGGVTQVHKKEPDR